MILAGDVGGTKTILAFWENPEQRETATLERFPSRNFASLDEIVERFVANHRPRVTAACFGVAGPVRNGRCEATNLPWVVDARSLQGKIGGAPALLINDLEANAQGIPLLGSDDVCELQAGMADATGNRAILSAGTGLGEAGIYWDGETYHPFAAEGGHADFAPKNDLEVDLLRYLAASYPDHVSWERVVSGPGLYNVYRFLRDTGRGTEPPAVTKRLGEEDPSAVVSELGLSGTDVLCTAALDLFFSLYGAEAGNLALKVMATGGLYVGGGVAPKNLAKIKDGTFMEAFLAKGRMRPLLERVPVRVILNERLALLGAARCAAAVARSGAGKPPPQ